MFIAQRFPQGFQKRKENQQTAQDLTLNILSRMPFLIPNMRELLVHGYYRKSNNNENMIMEIIGEINKFTAITKYEWIIKGKHHSNLATDDSNTKITRSFNSFSSGLAIVNIIVTNAMCNKFDIEYLISKPSGISNYRIGYARSIAEAESPNSVNVPLGRGRNEAVGFELNGKSITRSCQNKDQLKGIDIDGIDIATNLKIKLSFDFINDEVGYCVNDQVDKIVKYPLNGVKCIVPAVTLWRTGPIIEITKCNFYR